MFSSDEVATKAQDCLSTPFAKLIQVWQCHEKRIKNVTFEQWGDPVNSISYFSLLVLSS